MTDTTLLGPWVRRFLLEYLVKERNLAINMRVHIRTAIDRLDDYFERLEQNE